MPDDKTPTSDEVARIATDALNAVHDAIKAGIDLPVDSLKLLLRTAHEVTGKVEQVVRHYGSK